MRTPKDRGPSCRIRQAPGRAGCGFQEARSSVSLTIADSFIYFHKGAFPCLFLMECTEGFARFEVKNQESLDILMVYCSQKNLHVGWAKAVADDSRNRKVYRNFPGGKYVASCSPIDPRHN
ncbi:MAG: hypothetical protein HY815_24035 [Candidatus Riflebacteria bacterium]|nr:hypothetical protein [Candidatus Riflebacteria bacterium]